MKKLLAISFCSVFVLLQGGVAMSGPVNFLSEEKVKSLFQKEGYTHPVIHQSGELKAIPGLSYYEVFDQDQEAEDPLIPQAYVISSGGKVYRAWQIADAILEIGYYPSSAQEALALAETMVKIANQPARVIKVPGDVLLSADEAKKFASDEVNVTTVKAPSVKEREGVFIVELYSFTPEQSLPVSGEKISDASFNRHRLEIGPGICKFY